jgi:hypothetical protein
MKTSTAQRWNAARSQKCERDKNVVLEFRQNPVYDMLVALERLGRARLALVAAVTDEPPEEIAAAGHDRCAAPIKPERVDAWLNPNASDLATQYAILDDRDRPYYEHRLAA